uniref:vitamin-K-epoxide reductase (warfarin-sensitive) n=1 Tax=Culicoides sonorensis TaxID=179676 RepID=A0A336LL03_CULSO
MVQAKSNSIDRRIKSSCTNLAIASLIGTLISCYGFYVEYQAESNTNYTAMCDISEAVSCTKVFSTEYGKGFGVVGKILGKESALNVPNGVYGLIFYSIMLVTSLMKCGKIARIQKWMAITSNLLSCYLAYLLYFVIQNFCVVCVSLYVVNAFLLVFSIQKVNSLKERAEMKQKLN